MLFRDIPDLPRSVKLSLSDWVRALLGRSVMDPVVWADECQREALLAFSSFIKEGLMPALLSGDVEGLQAYLQARYRTKPWDNEAVRKALSQYASDLITHATGQWPDRPDLLSNLMQGIAVFSQACQLPAVLTENMVLRSQGYAIEHRYQIDVTSFQLNEMSLNDANALLNQLRQHLIERVSEDEHAVRQALLMPVALLVIARLSETLSQFAYADTLELPTVTAPGVVPMIAFLLDMPMETYYIERDDVEQHLFDQCITAVESSTMALSRLHTLSGVDEDYLESCESLGAFFRCQCNTIHACVERGGRINLDNVSRITMQYQHLIQLFHEIPLDPALLCPFVMDVARLQSVIIKNAYERMAELESDLLLKNKVIAATAARNQTAPTFFAIAALQDTGGEPMDTTPTAQLGQPST